MNDKHTQSIIGIDVSKHKLDLYDVVQRQHQTVPNEARAIKQLHKTLKQRSDKVLCVMEYTGGYEKQAHRLLSEAGLAVHVAHPNRVHYFAKQKGYFGKTDSIDAKILAEFGAQEQPKPTPLPSLSEQALKELSQRHSQVVTLITAEKCRLRDELCTPIQRSIRRMIKHLETEKILLAQQIDKHIQASPELQQKVDRLTTFKGVGPTISRALVALLPELGQISRSAIASLVGVAPKNHDSGLKKGRRHIAGGRFHIRQLLYMAALVAIRHNAKLKLYYEHLRILGKPAKVAIVAVMRKIIITLNAMLRDNKPWQHNALAANTSL